MSNYVKELFTVKTPEPIILQRTELGRFADCPHQGNLCEQHKSEIETHDILPEAGKIIHTIAEAAIKANEFNLQDAADYIAEELPKARPDLQPEVLRGGRNLANEIRRFGGNRVLLCEEPITRSLIPATAKTGEVLIVSELDLVLATTKNDTVLVLDYKTGHKNRTNQEARDDFQTCVGCWTIFGKYPHITTLHWFYLNTRLGTRSYCRIERESNEANFESRIFETARIKLEGCDDAWPEPTKCVQCDVTKYCKRCIAEAKELNGDPKSYLDSYVALDARLQEMHKTLSDVCKNGRVIYGTASRFDTTPKKKPAVKASLKAMKPE